jgi:hypothetical protein
LETIMEALFVSTGVVALAEIGDKTQLLAFILAARFKKPVPIILGILAATLLNHGLAGALGAWITSVVSPESMRWALGLSFIGMAIWTLIPDKIEEDDACRKRLGIFARRSHFFLPKWATDPDRHHRAGRALRRPAARHRRHDAGHAGRRRPGRVRRQAVRRQDPDEAGPLDRRRHFRTDGRAHAAQGRNAVPVRVVRAATQRVPAIPGAFSLI